MLINVYTGGTWSNPCITTTCRGHVGTTRKARRMSAKLQSAQITKGPSAERIFTCARWATDSSVVVPLTFETPEGAFTLTRVLNTMWGGPASAQLSFDAFEATGPSGENIQCAVWHYDTNGRKSGDLVYVSPRDFHQLCQEEKQLFSISRRF